MKSIRDQDNQRSERGLPQLFDDVLVPTKTVIEVRHGRRVETKRPLMPSYILIKMELTDEAFSLIKNTPQVRGFVGPNNKPTPMTEAEMENIIHLMQESVERLASFEVSEPVRVTDGPFESFNGTVEKVDEAHSLVTVAMLIFGRTTLVELNFSQAEKKCK